MRQRTQVISVSQVVRNGAGFSVRHVFQLERRAAVPESPDPGRGASTLIDSDMPIRSEVDPN